MALVQVTSEYMIRGLCPAMISEHARGVVRVRDRGNHSVGKTQRSAFYRAVADAEREAAALNSAGSPAEAEQLMSYGSA